jgi:integrase
VRWFVAGRGSAHRQKTFPHGTRRKQVEAFVANLALRRAMGELALYEQRERPLRELSAEWWAKYAVLNLAEWTRVGYKRMLVSHIEPRLGSIRVGDITPEVVARFRVQLEQAGVGRHSVRLSMVVLQAMFQQAIRWGWVPTNPVKAVRKPPAKRQRAVVCLAPSQVEAIRRELLARDKLYTATIVSLVAYQGLRVPEEVLALEVGHVRCNTLLVEQRNIDGRIVGGQKVRGFHPRAIDLLDPVRRDVREYMLAHGIRDGLLFARRDGAPWRLHDYQNWRRRIWHAARTDAGIESLPPYDLRHAFASLQIRAGLSIPEIAEQMGHSSQMTLSTYAHVIRELKGEPVVTAEQQIERARKSVKREAV